MTAKVNKVMLVGELIVLAIFLVIGVRGPRPGQGPGLRVHPALQRRHLHLEPGLRGGLDRRAQLPGVRRHLDARRGEQGLRPGARAVDGRGAAAGRRPVHRADLGRRRCWCPTRTGSSQRATPAAPRSTTPPTVAGGPWLAKLTALATAIAWGFANSLVAQAATSRLLYAMARDRQLPSFLAKVAPEARACRSTPRCWSPPCRWSSGSTWPAATTASRCCPPWSTSVR